MVKLFVSRHNFSLETGETSKPTAGCGLERLVEPLREHRNLQEAIFWPETPPGPLELETMEKLKD
jgi:hypothetical protein